MPVKIHQIENKTIITCNNGSNNLVNNILSNNQNIELHFHKNNIIISYDNITNRATNTNTNTMKIGIVYDMGNKNKPGSYNYLANIGLRKFLKKYPSIKVIESILTTGSDVERENNLNMLIKSGCNTIICVGFLYGESLTKVAAENPTIKFSIIDDSVIAENVNSLMFNEEQSSFLVGVIAAFTTKKKNIGFIGGVNIPLIQKYEAGFKAGIALINPNIKYQSAYVSNFPDFFGFNNPEKGKSIALDMYNNGADIIYSVAGGSGAGVLAAVAQKGPGYWTIGVDTDETLIENISKKEKPLVLTSSLKNIDVAVETFLNEVFANKFKSGTHIFDASNGGIGFSTSGKHLSSTVIAKLKTIQKMLASNKIIVPTVPTNIKLPTL